MEGFTLQTGGYSSERERPPPKRGGTEGGMFSHGGHVIFHSKYSFGEIFPLFNFVFISHHSERKSFTNPYSKVNATGEPALS